MALKTIVDSLDAVEEQYRDLYTEQDGSFVLDIEGVENHPGAKSLKAALDRVRAEKRAATEKLTAVEQRLEGLPDDFDAEAYQSLEARAAGSDPEKLDERLDRQRAADKAKYDKDMADREKRIEKLDKALRRVMVDEGLTKALLDAGVSKEHLRGAKALLKEEGKIRLVEDDGEYHVYADDGIDERTPLTKFVGDWTGTDEGKSYVAKASGSDAKGGQGQRFSENPWDTQGGKIKPNLTKQQEVIAQNPEKARQMAQAAGVQPNW